MPFFKKSLAGPGYIVLQVIRVLNIITLTAVVAASFAMLVKTFNISKFFFFDGVTHVITGFLSMALIITEVGLFRRYIANNWPLLSPSSGFVTLGVLMIILGVSLLGNLNKTATSKQSLGEHYWSLVIAAGILVSILGIMNIFASYMFRQKSLDITARQVRAHGSTAPEKVYVSPSTSRATEPRRSFHLSRRTMSETLPSYHTQQPARNISNPLPSGSPSQFDKFAGAGSTEVPVVHGVQRPDLAAHPAFQGQSF